MTDEKEAWAKMQETIRDLIDGMRQEDQFHRTAAFFDVVASVSGLTEDESIQAFLLFVRTRKQVWGVRLDVAWRDGEWMKLNVDSGDIPPRVIN